MNKNAANTTVGAQSLVDVYAKHDERSAADSKISDRMKVMQPSAVREIFKFLDDPNVISFAGGNPSEKTFPIEELAECSARLYKESASVFLQYGVTEGYAPLRELTLARAERKFNIVGPNDTILITTGGQQGIDLTMKVLTNEGDYVGCEDPSFIGAINDIRSYRCNFLPVPLIDYGIDIEKLEEELETKSIKVFYTIPTFQNPGGVTMSLECRKKLYELAVKYDFYILEDDPYHEMRCYGEEVPCIKSLDTEGRVIYCGSYSKIIAPSLRVGYLILDKSLLQKFAVAKQCADVHSCLYPQMLVADYLKHYDVDAHVAENCRIYTTQLDRMLSGLDKHMDPRVKFTRPQGGFFVWCILPEGNSGAQLCGVLAENRVACVPGSTFDPMQWRDKPAFRINYSVPTLKQIDEGTEIVGRVLREFIK